MYTPSPPKASGIRPELLALHGQLEHIKELASLSERRSLLLEARLREQEEINKNMMDYLNSSSSVHVLKTPKMGTPATPFSHRPQNRLGEYLPQPLSATPDTNRLHRDMDFEAYSTPLKSKAASSHQSPGGKEGYPPRGVLMSPGLSPIVKTKSSDSRKGTLPSDTRPGTATSSLQQNEILSMPSLSDIEGPKPRSFSIQSNITSDDGSDLPLYGHIPSRGNHSDNESLSFSKDTETFPFTPPRDYKPINPAPRSLSATKHRSAADRTSLHSKQEDAESNPEPRVGPLSSGSRDSEDYSCNFEEDDGTIGSRPISVQGITETTGLQAVATLQVVSPSTARGSSQATASAHSAAPLNAADPDADASLQLISLLDISAGTIRGVSESGIALGLNHPAAVPRPHKVEPFRTSNLGAKTLSGYSKNENTSLSYSASTTNVYSDLNTSGGIERSELPEPLDGAPLLGIAFELRKDHGAAVAAQENTEARKQRGGVIVEDESGQSDVEMNESLEIDWTFVATPNQTRDSRHAPPSDFHNTKSNKTDPSRLGGGTPLAGSGSGTRRDASAASAATRYQHLAGSSDNESELSGGRQPSPQHPLHNQLKDSDIKKSVVLDSRAPPGRSKETSETGVSKSTRSPNESATRRHPRDMRTEPNRKAKLRRRKRARRRQIRHSFSHFVHPVAPPPPFMWPYRGPPPPMSYSYPEPPYFSAPPQEYYRQAEMYPYEFRDYKRWRRSARRSIRKRSSSGSQSDDSLDSRYSLESASEVRSSGCTVDEDLDAGRDRHQNKANEHRGLYKSRRRRHSFPRTEYRYHRPAPGFAPLGHRSVTPDHGRRVMRDIFAESYPRTIFSAPHPYTIPPPVLSPTFQALPYSGTIRLNSNQGAVSLHSIVQNFRKTYTSYASPGSGRGEAASPMFAASSDYWRQRIASKRFEE